MKVWINYRSGGYSGGMILVAANSAEEAHDAGKRGGVFK